MKEYKIVILGGGGVGKSSITVRYVHDIVVERYDPTIEDSYRKIVLVDGNRITVEILDTAGTEQFMALHSLYVRGGDGFLLVFALNAPDSLHELEALHQSIVRIKTTEGLLADGKIPLVLVGNKCDLTMERAVQRDWACDLSQAWGHVPYYETSARRNTNIEEIFVDLVRQIIKADRASGGRLGSTSGTKGGGGRGRRKRGVLERACVIL